MSTWSNFLASIDDHSWGSIEEFLADDITLLDPVDGITPMHRLVGGRLRTERFVACVRVLLRAGTQFRDPLVRAVLLDDVEELEQVLAADGGAALNRRMNLPCAYTPCLGVTALHLCAEHNSVACARALIAAGADVNARAELDCDGFGGQTPVFHSVNSVSSYCRPVLEVLVEAGADLDQRVRGLRWGLGSDWETLIVDVTPLSYAQCGLYRQIHNSEDSLYATLSYLYRNRWGTELRLRNVPNAFLWQTRHM